MDEYARVVLSYRQVSWRGCSHPYVLPAAAGGVDQLCVGGRVDGRRGALGCGCCWCWRWWCARWRGRWRRRGTTWMLRSVLLLPIGGLMSYGSPEATERAATPEMQKRMAVVGPIANLGFGLVLGATGADGVAADRSV